jgi:signal transduction histidine kinase
VSLTIASPPPVGPAGTLTADRLAVERMLANLVDNALKSAPSGGHVWLEVRDWGGPTGRSPSVVFGVTDDGPGFPPGATDRVFDRFYRADPSRPRGGSGLGLTIVRELARAHGGDARAENVAPHGARVSIILPVVPAAGPVSGVVDAAAPAGRGAAETSGRAG